MQSLKPYFNKRQQYNRIMLFTNLIKANPDFQDIRFMELNQVPEMKLTENSGARPFPALQKLWQSNGANFYCRLRQAERGQEKIIKTA